MPDLVTLDEAKQRLNIPTATTTHDAELAGFISSVTDVVEDIVGVVVSRVVTETHSGDGSSVLVLRKRPVLSVTSVTVNGAAIASSGYSLGDIGRLYRVAGYYDLPWLSGRNNIVVTYTAGRAATPASVKDAALELIRINWRPQQGGNYSPFDGGRGDDFAAGQGEVRLGFFVPGTVMQRLAPHARGPLVA